LISAIGWVYHVSGITHRISQKETGMKIYVGNMSYEVTEEDLRQAFTAFGPVESVAIIKDRSSGQSKGFGFVEMPSKEEGQAAIAGMNGKELKGRTLNVNEALPRTEKPGGGGRGGYGGGGGRGGYGGGGGRGGGGGGYGGGGGRGGGGGGGYGGGNRAGNR
jgi:RNA recognition motif-containing protein